MELVVGRRQSLAGSAGPARMRAWEEHAALKTADRGQVPERKGID